MPLETATYISDLVPSNPAHSDGLNQADAHLRLIKAALAATFPNFTSAPLNASQAQLDAAVSTVTSGVIPSGMIAPFAMNSAPSGWIACDGAAVSRTTYAALFAAIGTTWGAGNGSTTFNVPELTSRYLRHRGGAYGGSVGDRQSPQNLTHAHTFSGTTGGQSASHTHGFSWGGTTGGMNANNPHSHGVSGATKGGTLVVGLANGSYYSGVAGSGPQDITINSTDINHGHDYSGSGNTGGTSGDHSHGYSGTTSADGGADLRPYSASVCYCIKT